MVCHGPNVSAKIYLFFRTIRTLSAYIYFSTDLFPQTPIYMTKLFRTLLTKCFPYTTFSYFTTPPVFSLQKSTGSTAASKFDCDIHFKNLSEKMANKAHNRKKMIAHLIEERNRYTVTKGTVDNSVNCG
jgi:hypothetical protein